MDLFNTIVAIQQSLPYTVILVYFAWYPLVTSCIWIFTSILFYRNREGGAPGAFAQFYQVESQPLVSFIIPAFNEQENIAHTIAGVLAVEYPSFEVVVIEGTGHYPMLEKPDEFNRALEEVVEGLTTPR